MHEYWVPGDDYTGDPAQEQQGLNSVFRQMTVLSIWYGKSINGCRPSICQNDTLVLKPVETYWLGEWVITVRNSRFHVVLIYDKSYHKA